MAAVLLTARNLAQLTDIKSDDYICEVARSLAEASQFVEEGFEYVTEMEDCKLFRKRK